MRVAGARQTCRSALAKDARDGDNVRASLPNDDDVWGRLTMQRFGGLAADVDGDDNSRPPLCSCTD